MEQYLLSLAFVHTIQYQEYSIPCGNRYIVVLSSSSSFFHLLPPFPSNSPSSPNYETSIHSNQSQNIRHGSRFWTLIWLSPTKSNRFLSLLLSSFWSSNIYLSTNHWWPFLLGSSSSYQHYQPFTALAALTLMSLCYNTQSRQNSSIGIHFHMISPCICNQSVLFGWDDVCIFHYLKDALGKGMFSKK